MGICAFYACFFRGLWRIPFEHLSCFSVLGLFAFRGWDLTMTSQMSRAVILVFGLFGYDENIYGHLNHRIKVPCKPGSILKSVELPFLMSQGICSSKVARTIVAFNNSICSSLARLLCNYWHSI